MFTRRTKQFEQLDIECTALIICHSNHSVGFPMFFKDWEWRHNLWPSHFCCCYGALLWDEGGWGRDPRKQKDFCTTVKTMQKHSFLLRRLLQHFCLLFFLFLFLSACLFGTNRTEKWVRNWKSEGRVDVIPQPPTFRTCAQRDQAMTVGCVGDWHRVFGPPYNHRSSLLPSRTH